MDEITEDVLRGYKQFMAEQGYAGKTIDTRVNIVYSLLKKNNVSARLPKDEMPTVEEEAAVPYADEELEKMFDVMTQEEKIALRAGVNCGQCKTSITKGRWKRTLRAVTCKTDPVCEHIYLHRLRKTCATRWMEHGVPIRTVHAWLGHKKLDTTILYLSVTDSSKLRGNINAAADD